MTPLRSAVCTSDGCSLGRSNKGLCYSTCGSCSHGRCARKHFGCLLTVCCLRCCTTTPYTLIQVTDTSVYVNDQGLKMPVNSCANPAMTYLQHLRNMSWHSSDANRNDLSPQEISLATHASTQSRFHQSISPSVPFVLTFAFTSRHCRLLASPTRTLVTRASLATCPLWRMWRCVICGVAGPEFSPCAMRMPWKCCTMFVAKWRWVLLREHLFRMESQTLADILRECGKISDVLTVDICAISPHPGWLTPVEHGIRVRMGQQPFSMCTCRCLFCQKYVG